ncbi:Mor transcription activator family protein [uncultured Endozoicomonas sp.]|uniref:Mor transcription activator family protein n=1 Tax=uncultured Endozoicomonas sp. TaxID=432652 RepID=UPI002617B347|nr:Mor transcription activator family protein [uncultured Endozoicomonas sp.]
MDDLFGIDDQNNDIMAHLDNDALHQKHYWPGDLVELADVIRAQLKREGVDDEAIYRQAERVLLAMAFLCGGRNYYLPKGERIKNALRNKRIYDAFKGNNHRDLARQFRLSEQKIYEVLREQMQLHRNRVQHNLFT